MQDNDVIDGVAATAETYHRVAPPGVAILDGYGCHLGVERSHLQLRDGVGRRRRVRRFARSDRTLQRVVVLGQASITTAALAWTRAVGVSVVILDDAGVVLGTTPAATVEDSRLRRAQAAALLSGAGLEIARGLIERLLRERAVLATNVLDARPASEGLSTLADGLDGPTDVEQLRHLEAAGARLWWDAWRSVEVRFVTRDRSRVPEAWIAWPGRASPLGGARSPRHAVAPVNAMLNLGYRLAEAEATVGINAMGLDSGFGVMHADRPGRSSFALDILEPLRPIVEGCVLDLVQQRAFAKRDFSEAPDGEVRVLAPLSHEVVELVLPRLRTEAAIVVEHAARVLGDAAVGTVRTATALTRSARRKAGLEAWSHRTGSAPSRERANPEVRATRRCEGCNAPLTGRQRRWCTACWDIERRAAGKVGSANARRARTTEGARTAWLRTISDGKAAATAARLRSLGYEPADWQRIYAGLADVKLIKIQDATGLSYTTASAVRRGVRVPAPQHWPALAALSRAAPDSSACSKRTLK